MQKSALFESLLVVMWGVVCLVTLIGSAVYFLVPYVGFTVSPTTGKVMQVFTREAQGKVVPGMKLVRIDLNGEAICELHNRLWHCEWQMSPIVRNGATWRLITESGTAISWYSIGFNFAEFLERLSGLWLGAVVFCVGGGMLIFRGLLESVLERSLLLQSNLWALVLMGLAWMHSGIALGAAVFAMAFWMLLPAYFQFHWMFPLPLGRLPRAFWAALYSLAVFMGMWMVWKQPEPEIRYLLPLFLLVSEIFLLLVAQWRHNATQRAAITAMWFTWLLGVPVTFAIWSVVVRGEPFWGWERLLLLVCITPMINLVTLYRYSANPMAEEFVKHLSIATFTVIFLGVVGSLAGGVQPYLRRVEIGPGGMSLMVTAVMVAAHWGYVRFDRLLKRFYLGIYEFPTKTLAEFGWAITRVNTTAEITGVLRNYIFDPMRINQAVIFVNNGQEAQTLLQIDVTDDEYPPLGVVSRWLEMQYMPPPEDVGHWVRRVLALRNNDRLVGLCCLGRRTPENLYYTAEIQPMMRLLNQAIMAWSNLELTRNLRAQIQNNLTLQEQQRLNLARDLHDSVLGELGLLRRAVVDASPEFTTAYNQTVARIREIISGLRPNMLNYGLYTALTELADDPVVQIQVENPVPIEVAVPQSAERYPEAVELQVYRIVQQACQNACRHAAPSRIVIGGKLLSGRIKITITDDGKGIGETRPIKLGSVPSERRFGIHGMYERAMLIGANLHIGNNPYGKGTQVMLEWHSDGTKSTP